MAPPNMPKYSDHPRYSLRRFIIVADLIGAFFAPIFSAATGSGGELSRIFLWSAVWLAVSIAICFWDLINWRLHYVFTMQRPFVTAAERAPLLSSTIISSTSENNDRDDTDGDDDQDKPKRVIILLDFIFFIGLCIQWTNLLGGISGYYRYERWDYNSADEIMQYTYVSMILILSSIAHACCFWKELMALKKRNWTISLAQRRRDWQNQLVNFLQAAAQENAARTNHLNPRTATCNCPCNDHADEVARVVQQENTLIDRLMRVLGKSPDDRYETLPQEEDGIDTATITPATRPNVSDEESILDADPEAAAPTSEHLAHPIMTPSPSTSDTEAAPPDTLHVGTKAPASQHSPTSERSESTAGSAVLVKKKGKNLRKQREFAESE